MELTKLRFSTSVPIPLWLVVVAGIELTVSALAGLMDIVKWFS